MRSIPADEISAWVRAELVNPERSRPVVAVTTNPSTGRPLVDLEEAERRLAEFADLVLIETGDATWALTDALPERLDAYGGALRVWWPGLRQDSNPRDHRLYLAHDQARGAHALNRLEAELRQKTRPPEESAVAVVVESLDSGIVLRDVEGNRGRVVEADVHLRALALCLGAGDSLRAVPIRVRRDGSRDFSLSGLLPDPWSRIGAALDVDDVVDVRVLVILDRYALVELLPGVKGIVHVGEVAWDYVSDISDFLREGEIVRVQIIELEPDQERAQLSVKRAQTANREPRPSPSLVEGGRPFDWTAYTGSEVGVEAAHEEEAEDLEALEDQLEAVSADRAALRRQVQELKAKLHSAEDRRTALERRFAPQLEILSSERAFLLAVRVAHARDVGEGERFTYPLQPMRVGPEFLASVRTLEGVELDKIVEVVAQVACDKAHTIPGREVHSLHQGPGGSPQHVRARDDAKAWRCALQTGTPGARRLHWWRIPGPDGATVEFASVGHHDDVGIPE